jgi:hypothetical protein
VRAALPAADLLAEKSVWTTPPRVRTLALKCGFAPPPGVQRRVILQWIEDFRLEREGVDLEVEHLQDAPPPATVDLDAEGVDDDALARLRELDEAELQTLVEEAERESALAADFAAAEERKATRDALSAVHAAKMKALRERLNDSNEEGEAGLPPSPSR